MPADLTPAEKAAFKRLDEIMPGWQTEPGAIHGHEIRAAVAAVRPVILAEVAAQIDTLLADTDNAHTALIRLDRWLAANRRAGGAGR